MKERKISLITNPYPAKRDAFRKIADFIEGDECLQGKVLVLYGLRRTGKTTLMEQYIAESPCRDACAFYVVGNGDTMDDVFDVITRENEENAKTIFFFDEITRAGDFAEDSSYLADIYAKEGIRIILTGTDSLGFYFAEASELAFRVTNIKTSHIPFAEHCRIFGERDMDDYIRFGGLMKPGADKAYIRSYEEACKYLDESVAENIAGSLEKARCQPALKRPDHDEMKIIIEKLVELYNGGFDLHIMKNELKNVTVAYPIKKLDGLVDKALIRKMVGEKKDMAREFVKKINADGTIRTEIDEATVFWLEHYLRETGVLSVTAREYFMKDENGVWNFAPREYEYYIVQPAIKYYHLMEALKFIEDSSFYKALPQDVKEYAKAKLEEQIFGRMTEEIILFDVTECLPKDAYDVCRPHFEIDRKNGKYFAEYDMLVCCNVSEENITSNTRGYYAFEIKHSSVPVKDQCKHLQNPEIKEAADFQFGDRKGISVLYRGDSFVTTDGVYYLNLADFLITLDQYKDMEKAMDHLTKDLPVRECPEEAATMETGDNAVEMDNNNMYADEDYEN